MRSGSASLKQVLTGDFNWRWVADVISNGTRVMQDLPLTGVTFDEDGTSLVQGSGACTVVYQGKFAESIAPVAVGDLLSPFGTTLAVSILVTSGDVFTERVPMGVYLIAETPKIETFPFAFNGALLSKGDRVQLSLKDSFYGVQRDRFAVPGQAPSRESVWREYQRLTDLPITRTITDAAIGPAVAYQEDKLQACYDLAAVLDATACMLPDGSASMRPNAWPAPVAVLSSGDVDPHGTLVDVGRAMSNEDVYNQVIVRTNANDGTAVLGSAEITDGPLRTRNVDGSRSPYRRVPYFYSSDYITTQAQGQAYARQLLPRVSRLRSISVELVEKANPLREVGDVLTVRRMTGTFVGRVVKISRRDRKTQTTTVVVSP